MKLDLSLEFDQNKFKTYSEKLISDGSKCELKVIRHKRSIPQNAYFHVVVSCFCVETGYTIQEAKTLLKRQFGRFMIYEKEGTRFLISTVELDTLQMTEFIEWIRNVACFETLGLYVPTSEEYIENQFIINQQINHVV